MGEGWVLRSWGPRDELLRAVRLERARELLAAGEGSVAEVAYAVGFTSRRGFTRAYRSRYGESPSATLAARSSAPQSPP